MQPSIDTKSGSLEAMAVETAKVETSNTAISASRSASLTVRATPLGSSDGGGYGLRYGWGETMAISKWDSSIDRGLGTHA
ncbi:MAG TPA: hypothetical protein VLM85_29140 [Polyangiaceae bacterium]|nr:hypothetical protein [Polyangiaceae bacterium]